MEVLNRITKNATLKAMIISHTDYIQEWHDVVYRKLVDLQNYSNIFHYNGLTPFISRLFGYMKRELFGLSFVMIGLFVILGSIKLFVKENRLIKIHC